MTCGRTYEMRGIVKNHKTAIVLRDRAHTGLLDSLFHNMIILGYKKYIVITESSSGSKNTINCETIFA
jgi:hypothetical protein